jgi:hypothetical protein
MICRPSPRRPARRRDGHALPRAGRASLAVCTVAAVACGLAGCASRDGTNLARQACQHVERSLTLYRESLHAPSSAVATAQQAQAVAQLRDALPIAATAAGEAGQYQALMATLDESDQLPESLLVHALGAQCSAADSNGGDIPTPPPTAETPPTHPPPTGL